MFPVKNLYDVKKEAKYKLLSDEQEKKDIRDNILVSYLKLRNQYWWRQFLPFYEFLDDWTTEAVIHCLKWKIGKKKSLVSRF